MQRKMECVVLRPVGTSCGDKRPMTKLRPNGSRRVPQMRRRVVGVAGQDEAIQLPLGGQRESRAYALNLIRIRIGNQHFFEKLRV